LSELLQVIKRRKKKDVEREETENEGFFYRLGGLWLEEIP